MDKNVELNLFKYKLLKNKQISSINVKNMFSLKNNVYLFQDLSWKVFDIDKKIKYTVRGVISITITDQILC